MYGGESVQFANRRDEAVRAVSRSLGGFLDSNARAGTVLASDGPLPDAVRYLHAIREAYERDGVGGLRMEKRLRLLEIAGRDLAGESPLEDAGRALSDLADACLQVALDHLEAGDDFAIVAMGKLGARELNYVSDIDLLFVTDGDLTRATRTATGLLQVLGEVAPEGRAYEIDTNLRPEGRSGALVRSLEGYLEYYRRWAKTWEHQALIKARAAAGNASLGETLVNETRDLVFARAVSSERIGEIRKMKERVEGHARSRPATEVIASDVKFGPGGIRDIEFSVQLLQLVHGGSDPSVREPATLPALAALVEGGYLAEDDAAGLSVAYRWLRSVEHRLQLRNERRVRDLPAAGEGLDALARSMGFKDVATHSAADRFVQRHQAVLTDVRGRFEKLFYRPMIESLSETAGVRLSGAGLRDRLRILGYRDVDRAARILDELIAGTTRRAKIFRVLAPAMLRFLSRTPSPDEGLFAFLRLGEKLDNRIDLWGALRDNPPGLALLARVLGSGRLLGDLVGHVPEEIQTIADPDGPAPPKDRARLVREARRSLGWREPQNRLDGLRRFKRREMLRLAVGDISGAVSVDGVGAGLADLADACLEAALDDIGLSFAVIGMGKLGGRELNYPSDIDVMFVHDDDPARAERVAEELLKAIGEVTPEGQAFRIDPNLRPEGRSGPLTRTIESYLEYYERWSRPWEHQALIKARVAAGNAELGGRLIEAMRLLAFPERLSDDALSEIRHLKARMERERIPRGTDPRRDIKMGPGGMADIEFAAQMLQLREGYRHRELQVSGTRAALNAAAGLGLLDPDDAGTLIDAHRFLSALRDRLFLLSGRPVDALPAKPEDLEALGMAVGFEDQPRQELDESFLRLTRRARRVAEPLIYGSRPSRQ